MTIITCEECLHKVVCPICFSYKDVLNVKNYCEHYADKSALEKQIPKKPIYKIEELFRLCPNCDFPLPLHFKFCNDCGQALDWGDSE